jgi:hypothetical protein
MWEIVAGCSTTCAQILSGAHLAVGKRQRAVFQTGGDQIALQRFLVLQVLLGVAALDLVERRLGDIDVAVLDQLGIWRKKKVKSRVRIWAPSTSASVMMMIL